MNETNDETIDDQENVPINQIQTGGAGSDNEEPLPSTSGIQRKRKLKASKDDDSSSSSSESEEEKSQSGSDSTYVEPNEELTHPINVDRLIDGPYDQGQTIYNDVNSNCQIKIKKIRHRRETNYLEDHLFEISVTENNKFEKPPLLVSLLLIFREALIEILRNLAQFYNETLNHQMYVTVIDDAIDHGLNTGNYNVRTDPEIVTDRILTMLYNFLQSNMTLRLNKSFRFNIKVLSLRHAQDRTQRGGFHPHLLNGSFNAKRSSYLFFLPEGYQENEYVFSENCLLLSFILGHYLNTSRETFELLSQINSPKNSLKKIAGQKLLKEVLKICFETKISNPLGPHSLEELAPKLTQYFNCQVVVFNNLLHEKISFIYPPKFDDSKNTIFLFQEITNDGKSHINLINRIKGFERYNFAICLYCEKVYKSKSHIFQLHKCQKRKICDACHRYVAFDDTFLCNSNIKNYCIEGNKELSCNNCKKIITNEQCLKFHQCSEYVCDKCNTLVKRRLFDTIEKTQEKHKCFEFFCHNCKLMVTKTHFCKLKKTEVDKYQPALGFINLQIANLNNSSCFECYQNKNLLRQSYDLEWDEFLKTKIEEINSKCLCENHRQHNEKDSFVNLATLKIETEKRGTFETMVFCDDELTELRDIKIKDEEHNYCSIPIYKGNIVKKFGKKSNCSNIFEQNLNNLIELPNKNSVEKLIVKLIQFFNTTLICFGFEPMLFIFKTFIDHGINCKPVSKGQNIYSLEVEYFNLRFINLQNYFKVPINELVDLFDLNVKKIYFPEILNCKENYNLISLMPSEFPVEFYFNFRDTLKEKDNKVKYVSEISNLCEIWNFQQKLLEYSLYQINLMLLASTKFTSTCIALQKKLADSVSRQGILFKNTLPFARNFCTISGFIYSIFKMYYIDPGSKLYIIKNEHPKKIQSSKEEMEFAAYLQHIFPNKKFNNAFSLKCDRNFKRAIADVLCYDDNLIYFFNECIVHGHDPKDCPITSKKKKQTYFGRTFKDIRKEFDEKMNFVKSNYNLTIKIVWQCEWRHMKKNVSTLKDFLKSYIPWPSHHISPREAVRGARVEAYALRWRSDEHPDEKLFYVDCSSLYPYMG